MSTVTTDVLVIGEALVDVIERAGRTQEVTGGSAANTALALARLGRSVRLATALGDDARGEAVRARLAASGVVLDETPIAATSTAIATLGDDGAAGYRFSIDWRLEGSPARARILHTGSLAAVLEPGAQTVEAWLQEARAEALVSVDPNIRPALGGPSGRLRLERMLGSADIVKLSDEDAEWLRPGVPLADVACQLLDGSAALVVVTRGQHGLDAFSSAGHVHVDAAPTVVADTVGAGDTVSAALLDGLLGHLRGGHLNSGTEREQLRLLPLDRIEQVLVRCAQAAAITVSRHGANPPTAREVVERYA